MDNISQSIRERVLAQRAFEALDSNDIEALRGVLRRGAPLNASRGEITGWSNGQMYQKEAPETLALSALRLKKFEAWLALYECAREKGEELVSTSPTMRNTPAEMVWSHMGPLKENLINLTPNDFPILKCLKILLEEQFAPNAPVMARPAVVSPMADDFSANLPLLKSWLAQCNTLDNREELLSQVSVSLSSSPPKVM